MCYFALEIYFEMFFEFFFKIFLNFCAFAEVYKIVNEQTEIDRWLSFDKSAGEEAWSVGAWAETNGFEDFCASIVPVVGTTFESVEGLIEDKVDVRRCDRAAFWWLDHVFFIFREDGLAECLAYIAGLGNYTEFCR